MSPLRRRIVAKLRSTTWRALAPSATKKTIATVAVNGVILLVIALKRKAVSVGTPLVPVDRLLELQPPERCALDASRPVISRGTVQPPLCQQLVVVVPVSTCVTSVSVAVTWLVTVRRTVWATVVVPMRRLAVTARRLVRVRLSPGATLMQAVPTETAMTSLLEISSAGAEVTVRMSVHLADQGLAEAGVVNQLIPHQVMAARIVTTAAAAGTMHPQAPGGYPHISEAVTQVRMRPARVERICDLLPSPASALIQAIPASGRIRTNASTSLAVFPLVCRCSRDVELDIGLRGA